MRYDNVLYNNIDESLHNQKNFYSAKLINHPQIINSKENIETSKKYLKETELRAHILTIVPKKLTYNKYETKVSVLYTNKSIVYDNVVNYIFSFTITKEGYNIYKFDNVEISSNKVTYVEGREIHIHDGEAVVCGVHEHSGHYSE